MRRSISIITLVATLALALAALAPGVAAQGEPNATTDHPIVGAWSVDAGNDQSLELMLFGPGGTLLDASPDELAVGAWTATGDRTVDITFLTIPSAPDEGSFTIRASLEVAEDGNSFSGTYSFGLSPEIAASFGMGPGEYGPGEVTGKRIEAGPMGDLVGPMPDFGQAPSADPGASISPGPSASVDGTPADQGASPSPEASLAADGTPADQGLAADAPAAARERRPVQRLRSRPMRRRRTTVSPAPEASPVS